MGDNCCLGVCFLDYHKKSGEMNFPLKGSPVPLPIFQIPCEKFRGVEVSNHPRGVCYGIIERFPYIFLGGHLMSLYSLKRHD